MKSFIQIFKAFWTVSEKEVLPSPDRSVKREAQLQHEQFAYIAKIRTKV